MPSEEGNSSRLMQKLRGKHLDTIAECQAAIREESAQFDSEQLRVLADLRTQLMLSRNESDAQLTTEFDRISAHRSQLEAISDTFAKRQQQDTVEVYEDEYHQDGVESVDTRRDRMQWRREEMLRVGVKLRKAHDDRMSRIAEVEKLLKETETLRKNKIRDMLESLLHDLSTIAYVNVTEAQLTVQRAAVSVNEQLLSNQMTCASLISQLRQHELLKHRDNLQRLAAAYSETLQLMKTSTILWTQMLFCSRAFRDPRSRTSMLLRISQTYHKTKSEVTHALHGLQGLVATLHKTRETDTTETCGGTEPNGWLRHYSDDRHNKVFPTSPQVVVDEWRVFIEVILHNAQCTVVTITQDTNTIEQQLLTEMARTCNEVANDIDSFFTPSDEEVQLVGEISLDPKNPFPLHIVTRNEEAIAEAQREAKVAFEPICDAVKEESEWFIASVANKLTEQKTRLVGNLIASPGSVVPMLADATATIEVAAAEPLQHVRDFFVRHEEMELDFQDNLRWLEEDFRQAEGEVAHAGTVDEATEACATAMEVLEKIEKLYCSYHNNRVSSSEPAMQKLRSLYGERMRDIMEKLCVMSAEAVAAHNARIDEEAAEREKAKPVNPKDAKGAPPPQPLPPKIKVDGLPTITMASGAVFYVTNKDLLLGRNGVPLVVEEQPATPIAEEKSPAKDDKKAGQKVDKKSKPGKPEKVEPPVEAEVPVAAPEQPVTAMSLFVDRMTLAMAPVFFEDALVSVANIMELKEMLRTTMLSWLEKLGAAATSTVDKYCTMMKTKLEALTNERIRRHQRRAPTLQSQLYETRIRELEDGNQSRVKYFSWLRSREAAVQSNLNAAVDAAHVAFAAESKQLQTIIEALSTINSISALDTNARAFAELQRKVLEAVNQRSEALVAQMEHAIGAIRKECEKYTTTKMKSFEEGGTMAVSEVQQAKQDIESILHDADELVTLTQAKAKELAHQHTEKVAGAAQAHESAHKANVAELKFFAAMQELFAQGKGRISNIIVTSVGAQGRLEEALLHLEGLIAKGSQKLDISRVTKLIGIDYIACGKITAPDVAIGDKWAGDDEALSSKLRKSKIEAEALVRSSRAMASMMALDDLRKQLYVRGLHLGCLQYGAEFVNMTSDTFFDPPKPTEQAQQQQQQQQQQQAASPAGKVDAKKNVKGRVATPKEEEGERPDAWNKFLKVQRAEVMTAKILGPNKEQLEAMAKEYFHSHQPPLLRPTILGAQLPDVLETIARKTSEQEARTTTHIADAVKVFRIQVQKAHLLVHRIAQELFISLGNLSVEALEMRLGDVFAVFNTFYTSMIATKLRHSSELKGSLAAPANRPKLEKVAADEAFRQAHAKVFLRKFWGIVLREVQDESVRVSVRCGNTLQTLFTMFHSLVTPEHLVPGDEVVVGKHKGLKRLIKQRQQEGLAKQMEGTAEGKAAAAAAAKGGKKDDKKPAPKKDDKKGAKGGKGETREEEQQLPLLDKPLQDYVGVQTNTVRVFDAFKKSNPSVSWKNHYLLPSQWGAPAGEGGDGAVEGAADAAAKGGDPKKGAPKGGRPPPTAAKPPPPKGGGAELRDEPAEDEAPAIGAPVSAPRDRLHQQAVLIRSQTIDAFTSFCNTFAVQVDGKFTELERLEQSWAVSWEDAVSNLRTEQRKAKQQQQQQQ